MRLTTSAPIVLFASLALTCGGHAQQSERSGRPVPPME